MFHDTIVIWRDNQMRWILFYFIKWPETDMSDRKEYIKRSAYLLNPPRLIILLNNNLRKGYQKDSPIHILTPSPYFLYVNGTFLVACDRLTLSCIKYKLNSK